MDFSDTAPEALPEDSRDRHLERFVHVVTQPFRHDIGRLGDLRFFVRHTRPALASRPCDLRDGDDQR